MKTQTKYICEYCGVDYDTEKEAKRCEERHVRPVKIVKENYEYTFIERLNLPVSVTVEFENGAEYEYFAKGRV